MSLPRPMGRDEIADRQKTTPDDAPPQSASGLSTAPSGTVSQEAKVIVDGVAASEGHASVKPARVPFYENEEARKRRLEPTAIIDRPPAARPGFVAPPSAMLESVPEEPPMAPPSKGSGFLFLLVVIALVGGVIGVVLLFRHPAHANSATETTAPITVAAPSSDRPVAPSAIASSPPASSAPVTGSASAAPSSEPTVAAAPSTPAAASASVTATAEETVVSIDTVPPRATILVGGVKRGVSPLELKLPKSNEPLVVEIRHPGYAALRERVVPNVNQRLKLTLTAAPRVPPTGSGRPYHKFE